MTVKNPIPINHPEPGHMFRSSALAFTLFAGITIAAQAAEIAISDPYARAVPPGQPNSAVFLSLTNSSAQNHALVGAESPVAGVTELHTHVNEDGMMRMRRIDRIELPAGETVTLKPGGLHLMLIGLKQSLEPGASVDLTLIYDDGSRMSVQAPVRQIGMPPMQHPGLTEKPNI